MARPDWRNSETYEKIRDLDAVDLAWEFLRCNPDYQRVYVDSGRALTATGQATSVHPWGLSFRSRSRAHGPRAASLLDVVRCAGCRPPCSCLSRPLSLRQSR